MAAPGAAAVAPAGAAPAAAATAAAAAAAAAAVVTAAKIKTRNCCGENCGRAWTRIVRELCHLVVGQSYYPLLKNKADKVSCALTTVGSSLKFLQVKLHLQ